MSKTGYTAGDFGAIVAAACLAHDIGNPPFGHAGESAIQSWFNTSELGRSVLVRLAPEERADFERFEGNAQTFRILARLGMPDNAGGMQLTCATLAAVAKYPRSAHLPFAAPAGISGKKHNFFHADRERFDAVAQATGLIRRRAGAYCWCRHPLAFLVEAADDISYCVIDVEDAFRAGEVSYAEIEPLYRGIVADPAAWQKAGAISTDEKRVEYLRARTIDALVTEAADAFAVREEAMLAGEFDDELIALIPHAAGARGVSRAGARSGLPVGGGVEFAEPGRGDPGGAPGRVCRCRGGCCSRLFPAPHPRNIGPSSGTVPLYWWQAGDRPLRARARDHRLRLRHDGLVRGGRCREAESVGGTTVSNRTAPLPLAPRPPGAPGHAASLKSCLAAVSLRSFPQSLILTLSPT